MKTLKIIFILIAFSTFSISCTDLDMEDYQDPTIVKIDQGSTPDAPDTGDGNGSNDGSEKEG